MDEDYTVGDLVVVTNTFETSGCAYIPAGLKGKIVEIRALGFPNPEPGAYVALRFAQDSGFVPTPEDEEPKGASWVAFDNMRKVVDLPSPSCPDFYKIGGQGEN